MDIVLTGRHCTLTDAFREHAGDKVAVLEKYRDKIQRVEVQVSPDRSRRASEACVCEITLISRGPVVRATGVAEDKTVAFDAAMDKLKAQLRRAADRRKRPHNLRTTGLAQQFAADHPAAAPEPTAAPTDASGSPGAPGTRVEAGVTVQGDGPLVVREKRFSAVPLTLEQALDEMELVGHDFFLYLDAETSTPSVAYKRKGYSYGVLHLDVEQP